MAGMSLEVESLDGGWIGLLTKSDRWWVKVLELGWNVVLSDYNYSQTLSKWVSPLSI